MAIFYLDYENGNDSNDGSTWALAWKTITSGATAARIAPGDVIRIAKSPAPVSLGTTGAWTNLSKTVTLGAAQTLNIDLVEANWTAIAGGDTTPTLVGVATDAKQGSNCVRLTLDSSPQANVGQAYFPTGLLNLSAYQKISFWIKNSAAILATHWTVRLCSDTAGAVTVDTFVIPAIPSTGRWLPWTIARNGGGNLGASIQSIAIYTDSVAPAASSNILIDNFIACTTDGLNLQSLISKNSLEQGGTEGWYGIQSINGVTVLLDNDTNTQANAGRGYSGTTETVTTYKRETIKTALASASNTEVQQVMDSGSLAAGNIQFQGGWNTATTVQEGETFFDGLNGFGFGLYLYTKTYTTLHYLNVYRYNRGVVYSSGNNNTISTLSNANNNADTGIYYSGNNNTISTLSNANNNAYYGVFYSGSNNSTRTLSTSGNGIAGIATDTGRNYIFNALIAEATEVAGYSSFVNARIFSNKHDQTADNHWIFTDGGTINSQATVRHTASGIAWKLAITSANRASNYPLDFSIAKVAVAANALVTVKVWVYKDSAAGVAAKLVCRGKQIAGVDSDVVATAADVLQTWEELTITFTPTEAGVVEIEGWGIYVSASSNVYFDDMTITQA